MVRLGTTAKRLRESLGWTQRETADALGVSYVHLCNVENNKSQPSQNLLDRFGELWGVDLYVYAWCEQGDSKQLPATMRTAASTLARAWRKRIETMVDERRKDSTTPCSTSDR
jgi:transcriptional regulator with XRE-family HTH domain